MTTNTLNSTRDTLIQDTELLKQDAKQIANDLKDHANAHVDAIKYKATNAFDLTRDYVKDHPLHFAAGAFVLGFFIAASRRK